MTGLKSGSGDDLWGDDGDDSDDGDDRDHGDDDRDPGDRGGKTDPNSDGGNADDSESAREISTDDSGEEPVLQTDNSGSESDSSEQVDSTTSSTGSGATTEQSDDSEDDARPASDASAADGSVGDSQSYIIRRAVQDKSVQFERDERLTFFVHDDVADGERELVTDLQSSLGRDVPKFDVREAVYRAALRNADDVLEELLKMGYSLDEE